jgi:hypothetical protein
MSGIRIASLTVAALVLGVHVAMAEQHHRDGHSASGYIPPRQATEQDRNLRRVLPSPQGRGLNSASRDDDHDGIPNRVDSDDDGNGIRDDME